MTITFAEKLARMPGYQAGVPTGLAPESIAAAGIAQLASNESPSAPHPKVVEAIRGAAAAMNRYPDPDATLLRRRIAERYETEPGRIAVGNGSCEIQLAAADALCEPGAEIVYAWPSFSMYPYLAALSGRARDPGAARRGPGPRPRRDGGRGHRRDPAADRLQSQQPDRDPPAGGRDRGLLREDPRPRHGDPRRGLRRVPDRSTTPMRRSTCWTISRTSSSPAPSASATGSPGCGSGSLSGPPTSAPRSTPCASRSASTPSPRPPGRRRSSTPTTSCAASSRLRSSGSTSRRACGSWAWRPPTPRRTSPGSTSARPTRARLSRASAERQIAVRPGTPLGSPGHIRVSYGSRSENDRFLSALGELLD